MLNRLGIIRAERKATGRKPWQQTEVAKKLRWSPAKYQRIENGSLIASREDAEAIARLFGVAVEDLGLTTRGATVAPPRDTAADRRRSPGRRITNGHGGPDRRSGIERRAGR